MHFGRVESCTDFVQRSPFPGEFDIGVIALPADAGDGQQFPSRCGDGEGRLFSVGGRGQYAKSVDAGWGEQDIPARRGRESRRTPGAGSGDPSVLLEYEGFGGEVILVGDDAGVQPKLLLSLERAGRVDQVSGETTG